MYVDYSIAYYESCVQENQLFHFLVHHNEVKLFMAPSSECLMGSLGVPAMILGGSLGSCKGASKS